MLVEGVTYVSYLAGGVTVDVQREVTVTVRTSLPLNLGDMAASLGYVFEGNRAEDYSGTAVSGGFDVNGDGYDDLLIGARRADGDTLGDEAGSTYVVFGGALNLATLDALDGILDGRIKLAHIDGSNGFRLGGIDRDDYAGSSAAFAGDVNGDGFADIIIGAGHAEPGQIPFTDRGEAYVVFGSIAKLAALDGSDGTSDGRIELGRLDGVTGFRLTGGPDRDIAGTSVSGAGDFNGDGYDDLLIGAPGGEPAVFQPPYAGTAYIVLGRKDGFASNVVLSEATGPDVIRIDGALQRDHLGLQVAAIGDLNGDGYADVAVTRFTGEDGDPGLGSVFVLFGRAEPILGDISVAMLDGTSGVRIDGLEEPNFLGFAARPAGDLNGDGFDDLVIAASYERSFDFASTRPGEVYVVFGRSSWTATFNLQSIDGSNGFVLNGPRSVGLEYSSATAAGDVNGDGFDDLLVGRTSRLRDSIVEPTVYLSASAYVVFGRASFLSSGDYTIDLEFDQPGSSEGFRIDIPDSSDFRVHALSAAGDVDGDGFADFLLGAAFADPGVPARIQAGETYLIRGWDVLGNASLQVGDDEDNLLQANRGAAIKDQLLGGDGADVLISDGDGDVLRGGSGDDTLVVRNADLTALRLDGGLGRDTLRVSVNDMDIDLVGVANPFLKSIEIIDLTGAGSNVLTVNALEILNLSGQSNALTVRRNYRDVVNLGPGWSPLDNETTSGVDFEVFRQGAAVVKIEIPNALPVAENDEIATGEDDVVAGNLLTDDNGHGPDFDPNGDNLSVSLLNGSSVDVGTPIALGSGALLTVSDNGTFTYNPNDRFEHLNFGQQATDSFQYAISDPGGLESTATVTVTIHGANDAPFARGNAYFTGDDAPLSGNVISETSGTGVDSDPDDAANTLMVSAVNGVAASVGTQITLASGALLTVNANGTYTYNPTPGFGSLFAGQSASDSFTYTVTDPGGLTSTATVEITINGVSPGVTITGNTAAFTGTAGIDSFTYNIGPGIVRVGSTPYILPG